MLILSVNYGVLKAMKVPTQKNIKITFLFVLLTKSFALVIVDYRDENAAYEFVKAILIEEYKNYKKVMNKHCNKSLIMSEEEEHLFQQSNSCLICKKLINNDEEKVRDHCHVTAKFRGSAHWNCNINLQLTKKVPVIFHNLRGYASHLISRELDKFDVKISIIPNGLEKYMAFFLDKNFIDSMKFMNSSLDKLVKNFSGEDFTYLARRIWL